MKRKFVIINVFNNSCWGSLRKFCIVFLFIILRKGGWFPFFPKAILTILKLSQVPGPKDGIVLSLSQLLRACILCGILFVFFASVERLSDHNKFLVTGFLVCTKDSSLLAASLSLSRSARIFLLLLSA